ncbi:auxin efflux carrier [Xylona heveae TC161]|uniref:Auxin efflux carrier n=1 Tax=Xylona heveae (strain CBS 132557 / TC161) TaxID=1328760 RepID=A0A165HKD7_XYLHT|nr:auxin efflux carrier [Xylona heveae TC161]KZF23643.1 auxin efflux carrier [Xylona heveae TC161]
MRLFTNPTSFRLANSLAARAAEQQHAATAMNVFRRAMETRASHPAFGHLVLLVFEAVLEVVCVSAPGYIIARQGMFDAEMQKFVAHLNVQLFTPCLIFTKLASQLTAEKLAELAVIPVIFIVQTFVSYFCSVVISKVFRFKKQPRNFVIAMGVFGNSNSLPISLVLSLSKTISGLHWDKIPGDNDDEVAARGILYLLIFQQLGQLVRWSWGYHVLLAPPHTYKEDDQHTMSQIERGRYRDDPEEEDEEDLLGEEPSGEDARTSVASGPQTNGHAQAIDTHSVTTKPASNHTSGANGVKYSNGEQTDTTRPPALLPTPANGNIGIGLESEGDITSFPHITSRYPELQDEVPPGIKGYLVRVLRTLKSAFSTLSSRLSTASRNVFHDLPRPVQKGLAKSTAGLRRFLYGLWEFMNPPLWAMLIAIIVASVPSLQSLFFSDGTFIKNSVTSAVSQSGGVAVPLILVVLGANLARNTLPDESHRTIEHDKEETKLLIASLLSRMLLPTVIMAPLLALAAKFVPVSILDDPIFVIVCFLLTGAPSALQLAQICQINGVYEGVMSRLLFQSYVIWILPSTLILVMLALEVVEWAA